MKKHLAAILMLIVIAVLFTGCSSKKDFIAVLLKNGETAVSGENAEELLVYTDGEGEAFFKSVSIEENSGLFYSSYTFEAVTNISESGDKYEVCVTLPGKIVQSTGGTVSGNTITFELADFTDENDIAVYSDSNNTSAVFIIIGILAVAVGAFFYIVKRKQV